MLSRRKSGFQADSAPTDADVAPSRPRNRLSKPPSMHHNLKSASNPSLQDPEQRKKTASAESLTTDDQAVKIAPSVGKHESAGSVSEIVSRFEAGHQSQAPNNSSQLSLLSILNKRNSLKASTPLNSLVSTRRPSLKTTNSKDRLSVLKNDSRTSLSPSPSVDDSTDKRNFSRRSSYVPGVATRKGSFVGAIKEEKEPSKSMEKHLALPAKPIQDDARSFDEGDDEDWFPPPQVARAETPQSLDYTHLGGLSLGSLQVVNGRASPTPSNMSKQLLMRRPMTRDTSSDYGDVEGGDQRSRGFLNGDSVYSTRNRYRDFSWQSNGSSRLHDEVPPIPGASDPTTFLASEYMAELPRNPYAARQMSFAQREEAFDVARSTSLKKSASTGSMRSYESLAAGSNRSSSPVPSIRSDSGSVLRTTTKRTEMEDELFEDEALGPSPTNDRETPESWHSWNPPTDPRNQSNQGFESALEYSRVEDVDDGSHRSQSIDIVIKDAQDTVSTSVEVRTTLLTPASIADLRTSENNGFESALEFQSPVQLEPLTEPRTEPDHANLHLLEPHKFFGKSDSGYSSNVSLRSVSGDKATARVSMEADRRSLVEKVFKPILKSRKTAPIVPTFENIRPPAVSARSSTISAPIVSSAENEHPKKAKKLTKRLPLLRQKQPIILQTIQSIDDLTIPPVPAEATANLKIRSQEVPELESTYKSMNHSRNRNSVSTLGIEEFLEVQEIRFPSPEPERPKQERRRSWFGRVKEDKPLLPSKRNSKRNSRDISGISEVHAMAIINGLDAGVSSIGGTPYDAIPSRRNSQLQQRQSSQTQRPNKLRHRSMMDAETAARFARQKSASIRERDAWKSRASSFDGREYATRAYRPNLVLNMPPMPIKPLLQNPHHVYTPAPTAAPPPPPTLDRLSAPERAPPPPPHSPRPSEVNHYDFEKYGNDDTAPAPPPHSPRPTEVNRQDYFAEPEEYDNDAPAPPPPSHSPRPMDVSDNGWASQAATWAAHRQQAADHYSPIEDEGDVYPTIPLRGKALYHPNTSSTSLDFDSHRCSSPRHHKHTSFNEDDYQRQPRGRTPSFEQPRYYDRGAALRSHPNTPARLRGASPTPQSRSRSRSPAHSRDNSRSTSERNSRSRSRDQPSQPGLAPFVDKAPRLPSPAFGRFSGGLGFGFDREFGGLGGSAGTRDGSENNKGGYKSLDVRFAHGLDLGDVPVSMVGIRG
ncbi:uncharacterized protein HMPREF1541_06702 [Cyphellophora europaea CBS 101466]|uniref:Uncharacterized protein n=1 Tax=Cyphellophora europaea (strain CBS 101466) TaxID=1220924 RepID=W2RQR6_CYPE1|nr:uncharacterized protein HMPREF1541_06702 [Cyphellophora europaea CBS 101466]ETN38665.1 hypothetical protein HMPREF1541_06702 [Cyphellophora europaea CBS 101466]